MIWTGHCNKLLINIVDHACSPLEILPRSPAFMRHSTHNKFVRYREVQLHGLISIFRKTDAIRSTIMHQQPYLIFRFSIPILDPTYLESEILLGGIDQPPRKASASDFPRRRNTATDWSSQIKT